MRADADGVRLLWPKRGPHDKRTSGFVTVGSLDGTFVCKIGGMMSAALYAFKIGLKSHDPREEECEYQKIIESGDFRTVFWGFDCGMDNWVYPWLILDIDKLRELSRTPEYKIERGETWGDVRSGAEGYTRWIDLRRVVRLDPAIIKDKSGPIAEGGYPGYEASGWLGLLVPAKTPEAIVERLHRETVAVLNLADVRTQLESNGHPTPSDPQAFRAYMRSELAKWTKLIKDAGLRGRTKA